MTPLDEEQVRRYDEGGYLVVRGLLPRSLVARMIDHFMTLRAEGPKPGDSGGTADHPDDPNHRFPRMIDMHRWDRLSGEWAQRREITTAASQLLRDDAVLNQTMVYFKPPGARGQAMHQDQQYLTFDPLIGVWVALDPADAAVGGMVVAPGSHRLGLQPLVQADTAVSFTRHESVRPAGIGDEIGIDMQPGDALFFDGRLIHGSRPNTSADRWRRSFSCHYVGRHSREFAPPPGTHWSHLGGSS
jgi:ectoine hydroxylase-related dioxygenase (phytanoyl-CoA dioxygenase family)